MWFGKARGCHKWSLENNITRCKLRRKWSGGGVYPRILVAVASRFETGKCSSQRKSLKRCIRGKKQYFCQRSNFSRMWGNATWLEKQRISPIITFYIHHFKWTSHRKLANIFLVCCPCSPCLPVCTVVNLSGLQLWYQPACKHIKTTSPSLFH